MVSVTFTIDDEKFEEFKIGFLKSTPIPLDEETGIPIYTENQWIKEWGLLMYKRSYRAGKILIARETTSPTLDEDIID